MTEHILVYINKSSTFVQNLNSKNRVNILSY